jgi:hypothetical protein
MQQSPFAADFLMTGSLAGSMAIFRQRRTSCTPFVRVVRIVVWLAVAASFGEFASVARAACGDHVVTREMREMMAKYSSTGDMPAPPPVTPCHGPGCKSAPADAPVTPVPVSFEGSGKSAVWTGSKIEAPASERLRLCDRSSDHPLDGYCGTVFRPPEFLA